MEWIISGEILNLSRGKHVNNVYILDKDNNVNYKLNVSREEYDELIFRNIKNINLYHVSYYSKITNKIYDTSYELIKEE